MSTAPCSGTGDSPVSSLTKLLGGERLKVQFRNGTEHVTFVRALPLRLIGKWAELDSLGTPDAEAKLVELYAGMPEGDADNLTPESHDAVLALGEKLNRPIFARWQMRAADRAQEWARCNEALKSSLAEISALQTPPPAPASSSASPTPAS